jgi:hypothetical protein
MANVLNEEKKQQVLALGRLGWSLRRIQQATRIRRETASAYLKAAGISVRAPCGWGRREPKPANENEVITATLSGRKPNIPSYSVCLECKRSNNVCITVARGIACLGPVTQAGCGALCPGYDRGCYGCYGPMESPNTTSLANQLHALGQSDAEITRSFRGFNAWSWQFRKTSEEYEHK